MLRLDSYQDLHSVRHRARPTFCFSRLCVAWSRDLEARTDRTAFEKSQYYWMCCAFLSRGSAKEVYRPNQEHSVNRKNKFEILLLLFLTSERVYSRLRKCVRDSGASVEIWHFMQWFWSCLLSTAFYEAFAVSKVQLLVLCVY